MNINELKEFYIEEIEEDFFPFWEKAFEPKYGGVHACFNNKGDELVSEDKYTWSQGRFLWLMSNLYRMVEENKLELDKNNIKKMADDTYEFLRDNVFLNDYICTYAMTNEGEAIDFDGIKATSIFADTFVLISFNAYGRYFKNMEAFDYANKVLNSIKERLDSNDYLTEPYPVDEVFSAHSIPMIMSNCYGECLAASKEIGFKYDVDLEEILEKQIYKILDEHHLKENLICELITDEEEYKDTLLHNHINPGHTIECIWFLIDGLKLIKDKDDISEELKKIYNIFESTYNIGWDKKYGGLLRFVDRRTGDKPEGRLINDKFEKLISDTWDYKLWWPHSELLYTALLVYNMTNDKKYLKIYEDSHKYIFETFPNPNKDVGEWIQIRDRKGDPINKVVALPVKDPFHILRNFILIVDLLDQWDER